MYRLNEEQQRVVADAAAVADAKIKPQAAQVDADAAFPRQSIAALGERGLLGLTIPPAYGGLGHGLRTMAATLDTVAQRCPSTAMVYLMHLCGVACYTAAPARTEHLLREAAAGRHLSTLAFSETGSRSHFWAPVSREKQTGAGAVRVSAEQVVRHLRRPRRRLCGLDARGRRDDADGEHDLSRAQRRCGGRRRRRLARARHARQRQRADVARPTSNWAPIGR